MKTVVITGSARGFGLAMHRLFRERGCHIVVNDISNEALENAKKELEAISGPGKIICVQGDITKSEDIQNIINTTLKETGSIDYWINNAGVNQPDLPIWELDESVINRMIEIDLKGTILCSKLVMKAMIQQGHGQIFNVEGYGSNDAVQTGLSIYGTSKRAVTYFTEALAHEAEDQNTNVFVGKITPGIMITNFINTSLGDGARIELPEKTKKVYNILGDYPETIANFMVDKILNNKKNKAQFTWLTNARAAYRFMTCWMNKRDFFK